MKNNKLYNLICFPYAGAGASIFNEWIHLSDSFNIVAAELPGREKKFTEKPFSNVQTAINNLLPEIIANLDNDLPTIIFGHCMGSLLAYECTLSLLKVSEIKVAHLIVSGSSGPWDREIENREPLSDDDFVKNIERITGYKHPALEIPAMRELILPTLKADAEMNDNYSPSEKVVIDIPITTIRGSKDSLVSIESVKLWNDVTSIPVTHKELNEGHMYITENPKEVLNIISSSIK